MAEPEKVITEIVSMKDDGSLSISHVVDEVGISPGIKVWKAEPGTVDFMEYGSRHGVTKPGQSSTITKELLDGVWTESQMKEGDWD
ncbi:hypothetical protein BH10CYA1_BH10CYA1_03350 [soil metagenome]